MVSLTMVPLKDHTVGGENGLGSVSITKGTELQWVAGGLQPPPPGMCLEPPPSPHLKLVFNVCEPTSNVGWGVPGSFPQPQSTNGSPRRCHRVGMAERSHTLEAGGGVEAEGVAVGGRRQWRGRGKPGLC